MPACARSSGDRSACCRSITGRPPTRTRARPSRSASRCGWSPTSARSWACDYEQRESVELAFIAALQHLPPRQRAVLILHEVLGFSGAEVADFLETTPASVHSALQRARKTVDERMPERSQQATLRALGDERLREIVDQYVSAWENGDVDAVVALLAEDATLTMPPRPTWYRGREAVGRFLREFPLAAGQRSRLVPVGVNGHLAFGHYFWDPERELFVGHGVNVLTLGGDRITDITTFLTPETFSRLGLPVTFTRRCAAPRSAGRVAPGGSAGSGRRRPAASRCPGSPRGGPSARAG